MYSVAQDVFAAASWGRQFFGLALVLAQPWSIDGGSSVGLVVEIHLAGDQRTEFTRASPPLSPTERDGRYLETPRGLILRRDTSRRRPLRETKDDMRQLIRGTWLQRALVLSLVAASSALGVVVIQTAASASPIDQTITIKSTPPSPAAVGAEYTPAASASSGLAVTITVDSTATSVCSLSGAVVTFDTTGTCVIDYAQPGDGIAYNAAATDETITVIAALSAPTSLVAIPGVDSVVIGWGAPVDQGGGVVTGYYVTSTPTVKPPASCTATSRLTCRFNGLTPGVQYTFDVHAVTATATGPVGSTTPVAPLASSDAKLKHLTTTFGRFGHSANTVPMTFIKQVKRGASSVLVKATVKQRGAKLTVDGVALASGVWSRPITLSVGETLITIVVTAENGVSTNTYRETIERP